MGTRGNLKTSNQQISRSVTGFNNWGANVNVGDPSPHFFIMAATIGQLLGALLIGLVVSTFLLGIAVAQAYTFFARPSSELRRDGSYIIYLVR
jgi:hypothetical protein